MYPLGILPFAPSENEVPLQVGLPDTLALVSRQRAYRNAGPLPPHPYRYSRYVLGQDRRAPCTRDLIRNIQNVRQQGNSSRDQVEDEGVRIHHCGRDRSRRGRANQVYPGGLSRGCGEFGPVSGSEYSPERILPGPGR